MDEYLKTFTEKYGRWRDGGNFTVSSRVIPVGESLQPKQRILTREQVTQVFKNARSFALTECRCRGHYKRCDKPRDVCLLIDDHADLAVAKGRAWRITLEDVEPILKKAGDHGLVHLTLYEPGNRIYAICSCCPCCCHDLQLILKYGRRDLIERSDFIAVTDPDRCTQCGACIDSCVFGAREMHGETPEYHSEACMGCGLCVSACPESAIVMRDR